MFQHLKLNIYVFSPRFKEFRNLKNDISLFFKKNSKIEIYFLLVYGGIVVKMDNSHLFEVVLYFLFHTWEVKDNEIYNFYFFYMYMCVDVVVHFAMG